MTSVANYVIIEPDTVIGTLGDANPVYTKTFDAPDYNGENAVLSLMVSGFTAANTSMRVKVNGFDIGEIFPNHYASVSDQVEVSPHQFTQTCTITASIIDAVNPNTLDVTAVSFPGSTPTNQLDDCSLRDIILFYKVTV
jgi:hypothetical protein